MDIALKQRREKQRKYYHKYKFFIQQRKYFLREHEKALKRVEDRPRSGDPFTLSFD